MSRHTHLSPSRHASRCSPSPPCWSRVRPMRRPSSPQSGTDREGGDHRRGLLSVTRLFQTEDPLEAPGPTGAAARDATISVTGTGHTCVVAVFQRGGQAERQLRGVSGDARRRADARSRPVLHPTAITVVVEMEETGLNQARMIAHQFFLRVNPGVHTVRVSVARGSGPGPFDPVGRRPGADHSLRLAPGRSFCADERLTT